MRWGTQLGVLAYKLWYHVCLIISFKCRIYLVLIKPSLGKDVRLSLGAFCPYLLEYRQVGLSRTRVTFDVIDLDRFTAKLLLSYH